MKANYLAKVFEKAHLTTAKFTHENDVTVVQTINPVNSFSHLRCATPIIEQSEIIGIINSIRPFKSAGPDTIQNILIKKLPPSIIKLITAIINKCIQLTYWPDSFKVAKVIPILKSGKPASDPHNYRPISLLNALGKIFERVIYKRLIEVVESKQLLPDTQFGFRQATPQSTKRRGFIISSNTTKQIGNQPEWSYSILRKPSTQSGMTDSYTNSFKWKFQRS